MLFPRLIIKLNIIKLLDIFRSINKVKV